MGVMRRSLLVLGSAAAAVVVGAGASGAGVAGVGAAGVADVGPGAGAPAPIAPEADLGHHGQLSLEDGRLRVLLRTQNHGPSGLLDATVRIEFSVPPAPDQGLPSDCLWGAARTVLCRTGELRAVGQGRELDLGLWVAGEPPEVTVVIDTAWNGGASDRNPENHRHRVLVPATGDPYAF